MLSYGNMARIFTGRTAKVLLVTMITLLLGFGTYHQVKKSTTVIQYPEYLSFSGNYVFPVLKDNQVDVESVPGLELIYKGKISAKTLEDIYNAAGISLQPISDLTDHSSKAFKDYINNTFSAQIKKTLSTDDIQIVFGKMNGWDVARTVAKKDGQQVRFIYLKNGLHPVAVVAKEETDAFKKIEATVVDVEQSDLKKEVDPVKQTLKTTAPLVKDQKADELYQAAAPELRANTTIKDLTDSFKTAAPFIKGEITINGVSYSPGEFSAVLIFSLSTDQGAPRAYSTLNFKKTNGQWGLKGLTLPTIAAPAKKLQLEKAPETLSSLSEPKRNIKIEFALGELKNIC